MALIQIGQICVIKFETPEAKTCRPDEGRTCHPEPAKDLNNPSPFVILSPRRILKTKAQVHLSFTLLQDDNIT